MATRKSRNFLGTRNRVLMLVVGLLILSTAVWAISAHKHKLKSGTIPTISQGGQTVPSADNPNSEKQISTNAKTTGPTSSTTPTPAKNTGSPSSTDNTLTPSGTFVSNHKPGLGSTSAPSQEQSVCNTSPGATCVIQFVNKDGITKMLLAQTAGSSGSVIWNWDVKQAGFSQGSWQITAIASLNGQTETSMDVLPMQIQP